ncbi:MAG: hypothetical protein AB7F39_06720 [Variibacter sp.]
MPIKPTVGRIVWYRPDKNDLLIARRPGEPLAAMITGVTDDKTVSLSVFSVNGDGPYAKPNVTLLQDGEPPPADGRSGYAEWMPFQKGQAAKTEQLEKQVSEGAAS